MNLQFVVLCCSDLMVSHTPSAMRPLLLRNMEKETGSHKAWLNSFLSYLTSDQSLAVNLFNLINLVISPQKKVRHTMNICIH